MIVASFFFPAFLMHAVRLEFNELDIKQTDTVRATHVRQGWENGTEASAAWPTGTAALFLFRDQTGLVPCLHHQSPAPGASSVGAHGCTHSPSSLFTWWWPTSDVVERDTVLQGCRWDVAMGEGQGVRCSHVDVTKALV